MLQPSYSQLMEKLNQNSSDEDKPIVSSRYSIVIAAAKRARQIIDGDPILVNSKVNKPVSIAVEELYQGKVIVKNKANQMHNTANSENPDDIADADDIIDDDQYNDTEQ
ncbi:DNA-directed RNA polymerase subunit omega [Defluviitalea saccharophila]|uniref:DNA-directed RNA polymerase subunit omega n=1 Tax=Defluviitalea saccharophila TaxID=879970 RepID=UPI001690E910|nr:DNA-directed RNA polymerase subunit omega [Candidatus Epulonipiscium sp.]